VRYGIVNGCTVTDEESGTGDYGICVCCDEETAQKVADALNAACSAEEIDATIRRIDVRAYTNKMNGGDDYIYMSLIAAIEWAVGRPYSGRDNSFYLRRTPIDVHTLLEGDYEWRILQL